MFRKLFQNGICQFQALFVLLMLIVSLQLNELGELTGKFMAENVEGVLLTRMFLNMAFSLAGSSLFAFISGGWT
jgi:hypothetical protein